MTLTKGALAPGNLNVIDLTYERETSGTPSSPGNVGGGGTRPSVFENGLKQIPKKDYERSRLRHQNSTAGLRKAVTPPPIKRSQSGSNSQATPRLSSSFLQTVDLTLSEDELPAKPPAKPRSTSPIKPPSVSSHSSFSAVAAAVADVPVLKRPKLQGHAAPPKETPILPPVIPTIKQRSPPKTISRVPTPQPVIARKPKPVGPAQSPPREAAPSPPRTESPVAPGLPPKDEPPEKAIVRPWIPRLPAPWHSARAQLGPPKAKYWTIEGLQSALQGLSIEVEKDHSRLVHHCLLSVFNRPVIDRSAQISPVDDFAEDALTPVDPEDEADAMEFKFKQHGREGARGRQEQQTVHFKATLIRSNKEAVPKYTFHHVDIGRNILTPNIMLKFVPHLRDVTDKSDERAYVEWLDELMGLDSQSGFKPLSREQKIDKTIRDETAETLLLYIGRWIRKLGIPHCSLDTLIRYHDEQTKEACDKDDVRDKPPQEPLTPEEQRAAKLFTEAFNHVWNAPTRRPKVISLGDIVESSPGHGNPKQAASELIPPAQTDEEWLRAVEWNMGSYSQMGCMICFRHSCEHGEYLVDNQKASFAAIDDTNNMRGLLKRRWEARPGTPQSSLTPSKSPGKSPNAGCKNQCYRNYDTGNINNVVEPWTKEEELLLRTYFVSLGHSQVKAQCMVAEMLGRKCWDVYRKLKELQLAAPFPAIAKPLPKAPNLPWYNREQKVLLGDWQEQTLTHEYSRRETLFGPCQHEGPCTEKNGCSCVANHVLCERLCRCTAAECKYKFTGCGCHAQRGGKTCLQRQRDGKGCICVMLNRECDPVLCGGCGARERADPQNAHNDELFNSGCQNCALQRGVGKTVLLGKSQLKGCGYGLFAAEHIAADEFIIEYTGEIITHDEGVRREARRGDAFSDSHTASYLFTLIDVEGIWVDAAVYGNLSRYINHTEPEHCNIMPKVLYASGDWRIKFVALRDILPGEELFFNYGENFPNLTKQLLEDKENESTGIGSADKRFHGTSAPPIGASRKTTNKKKQKSGARKEAPDPMLGDEMSWEADEPGERDDQVDQEDDEDELPLEDEDDDEEEIEDYVPGRKAKKRKVKPGRGGKRAGPGRPPKAPQIPAEEGMRGSRRQQSAVKRGKKRGGRRPGAGRKPRLFGVKSASGSTSKSIPSASKVTPKPNRLFTGTMFQVNDSDDEPLVGKSNPKVPANGAGTKRKADEISTDGEASRRDTPSRINGAGNRKRPLDAEREINDSMDMDIDESAYDVIKPERGTELGLDGDYWTPKPGRSHGTTPDGARSGGAVGRKGPAQRRRNVVLDEEDDVDR